MNRKEREAHLFELGTSIAEETGEANADEAMKQDDVLGSFEDSGLPEFRKEVPGPTAIISCS